MSKIRIFLSMLLFVISLLSLNIFFKTNIAFYRILGDQKSDSVWVYLCGLTQDFDSTSEIQIRNSLDELGKKVQIAFIAIKPPVRCSQYGNSLCWPHETTQEIENTYAYILKVLKNRKIAGIVGFSNGGFFINRLVQTRSFDFPLISIGASGYLDNASHANKLFLIVGKKDAYHYQDAYNFYKASQQSPLKVIFLEHENGHSIPFGILENVIKAD